MSKPVIGLTGGIASGKSTVARAFEALGIPIVDADELARDVVRPGTSGLAAIVKRFGEGVLLNDGSLDRRKLGSIVFDDEEARHDLNAITHPRIAAAGMERVAELSKGTAPYLLYEAALLVESGSYEGFAGLIVVAAKRETQLGRIVKRDGLSMREAEQRLDAQLPLEEKIAVADWVIWNDGSREELERAVEATHRAIVDRLAGRPDA